MANEEQLRILNEESVEAWNKWREDDPDVEIDLNRANLSFADLRQANLSNVNLSNVNLNFANLSSTNLSSAHLSNAILRSSNLSNAILNFANLEKVQALATNFRGAILTGACIKDWNINSETNLENVICDYIYLKEDKQERRPSDPNRNFEPGEFASTNFSATSRISELVASQLSQGRLICPGTRFFLSLAFNTLGSSLLPQ